MSITVNILYSGKNGNARKFVEEMTAEGIVDAVRAGRGMKNMNIISQWMIQNRFCSLTDGKIRRQLICTTSRK